MAQAEDKDSQPTGATGGGTDNQSVAAPLQSQSQLQPGKRDINIITDGKKGQGPAKQQTPAPEAGKKNNENDDENENDRQEEKEVLKPREDDKVSSQDHKKCEEAFKAAKISSLTRDQKNDIHKYEDNLIKMARRGQDKESSVINVAREKCGLGETDADLLATELIDRFGKSQSNAQAQANFEEKMENALVNVLRSGMNKLQRLEELNVSMDDHKVEDKLWKHALFSEASEIARQNETETIAAQSLNGIGFDWVKIIFKYLDDSGISFTNSDRKIVSASNNSSSKTNGDKHGNESKNETNGKSSNSSNKMKYPDDTTFLTEMKTLFVYRRRMKNFKMKISDLRNRKTSERKKNKNEKENTSDVGMVNDESKENGDILIDIWEKVLEELEKCFHVKMLMYLNPIHVERIDFKKFKWIEQDYVVSSLCESTNSNVVSFLLNFKMPYVAGLQTQIQQSLSGVSNCHGGYIRIVDIYKNESHRLNGKIRAEFNMLISILSINAPSIILGIQSAYNALKTRARRGTMLDKKVISDFRYKELPFAPLQKFHIKQHGIDAQKLAQLIPALDSMSKSSLQITSEKQKWFVHDWKKFPLTGITSIADVETVKTISTDNFYGYMYKLIDTLSQDE